MQILRRCGERCRHESFRLPTASVLVRQARSVRQVKVEVELGSAHDLLSPTTVLPGAQSMSEALDANTHDACTSESDLEAARARSSRQSSRRVKRFAFCSKTMRIAQRIGRAPRIELRHHLGLAERPSANSKWCVCVDVCEIPMPTVWQRDGNPHAAFFAQSRVDPPSTRRSLCGLGAR